MTEGLPSTDGLSSETLRAFDTDGRELWAAEVGGDVWQLSGDPAGGVVALVVKGDPRVWTLTAWSASGTRTDFGDARWAGDRGFAIHPNGALYTVRGGALVGLDIGLGAGFDVPIEDTL